MAKKITIRGMIGWSENATPEFLSRELADANGDDVDLEFASGGGFVMPGLEMANMIRNYSGRVVARITGVAASMSSYIPMMADEVIAEDNAIFMIHNVMGGMYGGDFRDAEKLSKHLRALRDLLAKAYVSKTGKTLEEIQTLMDDETFYYGSEIAEAGFADVTIETGGDDDKDTAMALATIEIQDCVAKMKEQEQEVKSDFEKAAAYLKTEPVNKKTETPAAGGKTNTGEVTKMTLKELLAANPAAKIEHDNTVMLARTEGATTAKADAEKAWTAAAPILSSADYPQKVKDRVIAKAKTCDHEGMLDFVALHDMNIENKKSEGAEGEQGAETPGQAPSLAKPGEEGMITGSSDDVAAAAKMMREG